ncbi:uncharacterized protein MKZ38_010341 [Zalerion maritima]|uniref:Uncharacterized protein n=1 Tax=Zalerion maritima TaxID=339359 RepID=A0AAD5RZP9_9PEZI|nr:uncharacterized protein MKZ38_010341 [Zalerion maritima]
MSYSVEMGSITDPGSRRQSRVSLGTPISPTMPTNRRWEPDLFPVPPSSAGTTGGESTAADGRSVSGSTTEQHLNAEAAALFGPGFSGPKQPLPTMDDYMFREHVRSCKVVSEDTRYLEIFNYEGPQPDTVEEHPLPLDEFDNFFEQKGVFMPPKVKKGSRLLNGIRLVIQKSAYKPETFSPNVISLSHNAYERMVRGMSLPFRAIESTSVVGPFFWSAFNHDDSNPHLHIVFRKSDVRKKAKTRGWEMMLSYSFRTHVTSGYIKGTASAEIELALQHLQACAKQVLHPMLLPIIVLSMDMSGKDDKRQRDARDWVRRLENAISMRNEIDEKERLYLKEGVIDLDAINRDLVECHSQVLWKRPRAYKELIREIERGMDRFAEKAAEWTYTRERPSNRRRRSSGLWDGEEESSTDEDEEGVERRSIGSEESLGKRRRKKRKVRNRVKINEDRLDPETRSLHRSMLGRLEFYTCKLTGIENYSYTTLERLNIQREVLYSIYARSGSKLSLRMAGDQKRLSHASKRDSSAMKSLSLMGALFLPATFISSVFSMTFFDFQVGEESPNPESPRTTSPELWIYFVITVPVTLFIVLGWWSWDVRREKQYKQEDDTLEDEINDMERSILKSMRTKTLTRSNTFGTIREVSTL